MKTWFITGDPRGFGRIWAEAALTRGDNVALTARKLDNIVELKDRFESQSGSSPARTDGRSQACNRD